MQYQVNLCSGSIMGPSSVRLKDIQFLSADHQDFPDCLVFWGEDRETPVAVFPLAGVASCFQPEVLADPLSEQGTGQPMPEAKAAPFYPTGEGSPTPTEREVEREKRQE